MTWKAKKLKLTYKEDYRKMVKEKWKSKTTHSKVPPQLGKECVDVELSFKWMKHSRIKAETGGLITVAQYQALNTRYYSKHITKEDATDRCRMCHTQPETVEHIISGSQTLATDKHLDRHNQVAG